MICISQFCVYISCHRHKCLCTCLLCFVTKDDNSKTTVQFLPYAGGMFTAAINTLDTFLHSVETARLVIFCVPLFPVFMFSHAVSLAVGSKSSCGMNSCFEQNLAISLTWNRLYKHTRLLQSLIDNQSMCALLDCVIVCDLCRSYKLMKTFIHHTENKGTLLLSPHSVNI